MDFAIWAVRLTRIASASAMPDEPVTQHRPLVLWHKFHQLYFNFLRVLLACQTQSLGQSSDMRVHHYTYVDVESVTQNYIGRLAADTAQLGQFFHCPGHLAPVPFQHGPATLLDAFCFVATETGRFDRLLKFGRGRVGVIGGGA